MPAGTSSFEVVGAGPARNIVEAWSDVRLPFEPKGYLLEFRAAIRDALLLMPVGYPVLVASYTSLGARECDVENALFYNLPASSFSPMALSGVSFSRIEASPPAAPSGRPYRHLLRYELAMESVCECTVFPVEFQSAPLPSLSTLSNPWLVWRATRAGNVSGNPPEPGCEFSLHVRLEIPSAAKHLMALLKPVLDGVISGLHLHDGSDEDAVIQAIHAKTSLPAAECAVFFRATGTLSWAAAVWRTFVLVLSR